ncbi:intradiol ring-cleavage dioxygenase [Acinetobacter sp. ANC 4805]|mgnify:FL=1|jgi:protocatechuate 3,4-dioxygenase beta subunit|uniref:intradiol ring-cleavage dioxygenase n=1 Tax=Acinetobacter sp. ANC 4805 TaxID=2923425 RepID=UPI001F4AA0E3|nr:intradiol ring-cleavage dioxygenase [Acinetobacter sp. ANC 4805]MCH7311412.1 intradiol ring-cleavage dioxygenase [Acinetobacter sp. ANC 4805]
MEEHRVKDSMGLAQDIQNMLARPLNRRDALILGAGSLATLLVGCGGSTDAANNSYATTSSSSSNNSSSSSNNNNNSSSSSTCPNPVPTETEGPYPADGHNSRVNALTRSGIVRRNIKPSLFTGNVAQGVPLTLAIKLVNTNANCAVLSGYALYLWHCDRDGNYSLYSSGVTNEDYLRGVQETDSNGMLYFDTIFPACYSGRWPHIHFEVYPNVSVATTYVNQVKTSQFALPADICSTVYNQASGYSNSVRNLAQVNLSSDNIFNDGYSTQMMTVTGSVSEGYTATIVVGIAV